MALPNSEEGPTKRKSIPPLLFFPTTSVVTNIVSVFAFYIATSSTNTFEVDLTVWFIRL